MFTWILDVAVIQAYALFKAPIVDTFPNATEITLTEFKRRLCEQLCSVARSQRKHDNKILRLEQEVVRL